MSLYNPCPCDSGKKFKFCCSEALKNGDGAHLESRLAHVSPVCFGPVNYQESGLCFVFVARKIFDDNYVVGYYLVDIYSQGVKDTCITTNMTQTTLEAWVKDCKAVQPTTLCSYEDARSLILGGVAYAAQFGIAPHADWAITQFLVEPNRSFEDSMTFGFDGKPLYVVGPYDDDEMRADIINKMISHGGNFRLPDMKVKQRSS